MGTLGDLELLICVFLVLQCRCESASIPTIPFTIQCSCHNFASGFQSSWNTMFATLLIGL